MRAFFITFAASLLAAAASAQDCSSGHLCLTSFRWCDSQPCDYGDDAYPLHSDMNGQPGYALIDADTDHLVSWENADPNYPVQFTWLIPPSTDIAEAHDWPSIEWSTNITDASNFTFTPGTILDNFPPSLARNLSALELRGVATGILNIFRISQPEKYAERQPEEQPDGAEDGALAAYSSQFAVASGGLTAYIDSYAVVVRNREREAWTKGVGIGVGLGVPALMAAVGFVTWKFATRAAEKRFQAAGDPKMMT